MGTVSTDLLSRGATMPKILDPNFKYTNAAGTNVADTFKRHGFKAPCKKRQAQIKRQLNPV